MPWSALIPIGASLIGSALGGDSAPSGPSGNVYQPKGLDTADSQLQALLTQNANLFTGGNNPYNTYSPQMQQVFQSLFNSPYAGGYQGAAGSAGAGYGNVGNQSLMNSTSLSSAVPQGINAGASVLNMGLDPQQALYSRMLQQTRDQGNVSNAQYGLTGQQAASNVNQDLNNFNIDWQNNELQRALSGLTGFNQATTTAGTNATAAQNVGGAGAGSILAGGATPYSTGQGIGVNQNTALLQLLANLTGGATASESTIGDLGNYLGQGIGASSSGASAGLNNYYAQMLGGATGSNIGAGVGKGISQLFGTQAAPANPFSGLEGLLTSNLPAGQYGPVQL